MRSGSNLDRPSISGSVANNLLYANQGGFGLAVKNLYRTGIKVIEGTVEG
jgi:purine nucleoside permease